MSSYLYSFLRTLQDLYFLGSCLLYLKPKKTTCKTEEKLITQIELRGINLTLISSTKGDLEIRVPRGMVINSKILFLDTDGISRLPYIDEALANQSAGNYVEHPEESLV